MITTSAALRNFTQNWPEQASNTRAILEPKLLGIEETNSEFSKDFPDDEDFKETSVSEHLENTVKAFEDIKKKLVKVFTMTISQQRTTGLKDSITKSMTSALENLVKAKREIVTLFKSGLDDIEETIILDELKDTLIDISELFSKKEKENIVQGCLTGKIFDAFEHLWKMPQILILELIDDKMDPYFNKAFKKFSKNKEELDNLVKECLKDIFDLSKLKE